MRFVYNLGSTILIFFASLCVMGFGISILLNDSKEFFVCGLSSIVFMTPILFFNGRILYKMIKYRKTEIVDGENYKKIKRIVSDKDPYGEEIWED